MKIYVKCRLSGFYAIGSGIEINPLPAFKFNDVDDELVSNLSMQCVYKLIHFTSN